MKDSQFLASLSPGNHKWLGCFFHSPTSFARVIRFSSRSINYGIFVDAVNSDVTFDLACVPILIEMTDLPKLFPEKKITV